MTLEELKTRCESLNIPYAYGNFVEEQTPPFLVAVVTNTNNFRADSKVYIKILQVELYFVYKTKNRLIEQQIEDTVLNGVQWEKEDEDYNSQEKVWQIRYTFSILDNKVEISL